MDLLTALDARRSVPSRLLAAPGPNPEQLLQLLSAAVRVPDHGKLAPWRFLTITGQTRLELGNLLAARALDRDPQAASAVIEKDRLRFSFAPLIVTVIAKLTPGHKVPEQEQLLSGGAVCFALLQAAQGLGFAAQWLTGWAAYDPVITARLGLADNERVLGFIHIGTASDTAPERERPDPRTLTSELRL
ncbi:MAG TPA: nitroreductase [Arenimonas sp.]|uniref:nitroreductase family protein n=1 Tax=Arenimonas sp. TaxID=1872635 RepID=UPI002BAAA5A3|nr:nitroreductase [Arenimonas sp.]HMB55724.1 nitroreductase [Arenimonas sp.]